MSVLPLLQRPNRHQRIVQRCHGALPTCDYLYNMGAFRIAILVTSFDYSHKLDTSVAGARICRPWGECDKRPASNVAPNNARNAIMTARQLIHWADRLRSGGGSSVRRCMRWNVKPVAAIEGGHNKEEGRTLAVLLAREGFLGDAERGCCEASVGRLGHIMKCAYFEAPPVIISDWDNHQAQPSFKQSRHWLAV